MRSAPGLALLAVAGCNAVFGIEKTEPRPDPDAPPPPPDAMWIRTRLSYQVAHPTAGPLEPYGVEALPFPTPVQAGELDGELQDVTIEDDGYILYPPQLEGKPWRLVYTPPGEPTHELQWTPDADAHAMAPLFGHGMRSEPPAGSGYDVMLTTSPALPRVFTVGIWTDHVAASNSNPIAVPVPHVVHYSGPKGTPDASRGDLGVVINRMQSNNCTLSTSVATFVPPALQMGMRTAVTATTQTSTSLPLSVTSTETAVALSSRINMVLGLVPGTPTSAVHVGYTPTTQLATMSTELDNVPAPVVLSLGNCPLDTTFFSYRQVNDLASFPRVGLGYATYSRSIPNGPALVSSLTSVALVSGDAVSLSFEVPLATTPRLGTVNLLQSSEPLTIPADRANLTFALETGTGRRADYYEVHLERVAGSVLETERIYVADVANPVIRFDPSIMTAGAVYVFSIRLFRREGFVRNDFTSGTYPMAASTIYTRTFMRQ